MFFSFKLVACISCRPKPSQCNVWPRFQNGQRGQDGQHGLDFPGHLCWAASQFLRCFYSFIFLYSPENTFSGWFFGEVLCSMERRSHSNHPPSQVQYIPQPTRLKSSSNLDFVLFRSTIFCLRTKWICIWFYNSSLIYSQLLLHTLTNFMSTQ